VSANRIFCAIPAEAYDKKKPTEIHRVIRAYGQAFERAAASATPTLAIAWLQPVYDAYRSRGMAADAERVQLAIANVRRDMQAIKVPVSVSKKELDDFLNALTDGGVEKALGKIVSRFIPKARKVREQNQESLRLAPLQALVPIVISTKARWDIPRRGLEE
jgi:hypothetical protein